MGFSKKNGGPWTWDWPYEEKIKRNCEVDDQEVQAQIQRHKCDEEKTPNRPDAFYSYINSEGKKIRGTAFTWRLLNTEIQRKTLCFCTLKEETFTD